MCVWAGGGGMGRDGWKGGRGVRWGEGGLTPWELIRLQALRTFRALITLGALRARTAL